MTSLFIRLSFHMCRMQRECLMTILWSVATGRIADVLSLMYLMLVLFSHPTHLDQLCFINRPEIAVCRIITPLAGAVNNADSHFLIPSLRSPG